MKRVNTQIKKTVRKPKRKPGRRDRQTAWAAAGILAAVVVFVAAVSMILSQNSSSAGENEPAGTETPDNTQVVHDGITYEYNTELETLLFLGVDKRETELNEQLAGRGGQSDCILLFIIDPSKETIKTLQISRDTMTEVEIYDINGEPRGTETMQLTLQYAYGDGKERSCRLTRDAVSRVLYGVDIDSYFAMNLEGFSTATDLVGGVDITVPEDYTDIDPSFVKGETVHLDGALAQKYVQTRDITVLGSNDSRMERQTQFLEALAEKMMKNGGNVVSYTKLYTELQDYIVTDMNADDLAEMSDYEFTGTVKAPGETRAGEEHDEFYMDEDALYELILELFYVPVEQ